MGLASLARWVSSLQCMDGAGSESQSGGFNGGKAEGPGGSKACKVL